MSGKRTPGGLILKSTTLKYQTQATATVLLLLRRKVPHIRVTKGLLKKLKAFALYKLTIYMTPPQADIQSHQKQKRTRLGAFFFGDYVN